MAGHFQNFFFVRGCPNGFNFFTNPSDSPKTQNKLNLPTVLCFCRIFLNPPPKITSPLQRCLISQEICYLYFYPSRLSSPLNIPLLDHTLTTRKTELAVMYCHGLIAMVYGSVSKCSEFFWSLGYQAHANICPDVGIKPRFSRFSPLRNRGRFAHTVWQRSIDRTLWLYAMWYIF